MSNIYAEGNSDRVIILVPDGNGNWIASPTDDADPMLTIVRRFGRATTAGATLVSASPTTLHDPAAGQSVRLKWIYLATPQTSSDTVATVKIGSTVAYMVPLPSPGIFMRTSIREGAADETLTIELSVVTDVYVNYELEEF